MKKTALIPMIILTGFLWATPVFADAGLILSIDTVPLTTYDGNGGQTGEIKGDALARLKDRVEKKEVAVIEEHAGHLKISPAGGEFVWIDELDVTVSRKSPPAVSGNILARQNDVNQSKPDASMGLEDGE
ncbi:hypothetical protein [Desulfobacter sp.]|uniref:hypothetical protein n=1 Tax=Desulfobacter sp. TaxID=2294 RepID=UPI003D0B09F5